MRNILLACIFMILSACQPPRYPMRPSVAVDSTFRIALELDGEVQSYGTAWIIDYKNGWTYLVTAGHVCEEREQILPGVDIWLSPPYEYKSYTLLSQHDQEYPAEDVAREYDGLGKDVCLIRSFGYIGPALAISHREPEYGERVSYVGAPLALYGSGVAPTYSGVYIGGDYISAPTAPGASGSGVFTKDGIIGVLVTVYHRFDSITGITSRQALIDFLAKHGLKYANALQTPEQPYTIQAP